MTFDAAGEQNELESRTPLDPLVGSVLDSRYRIVSRMAHGGMGSVYVANDERLDRLVAVKIIHQHLAESHKYSARFRREARAAARISHPGVVPVFDQGEIDGRNYLVMELIDGENLRTYLTRIQPYSVELVLDFTAQILQAVVAAHQVEVIHRDLKPENVLIDTNGQVRVVDFGLSRSATDTSLSSTGSVFGTISYLAPEVITGNRADARSDIFAVGVMLLEMLTAQQPVNGDNPVHIAYQLINQDLPAPSTLVEWLPPEVDELCARLCARDPDSRPQTAKVAVDLVQSVRKQLPESIFRRRLPGFNASNADGSAAGSDVTIEVPQPQPTAIYPALTELTTLESGSVLESPTESKPASSSAFLAQPAGDSSIDDSQPTILLEASAKTAKDLQDSAQSLPTDSTSLEPQIVHASGSIDVEVKQPDHKHRKSLFALLAVLIVVVAGFGIGWWWNQYGPGSYRMVPDLAEMTQSGAIEELRTRQLASIINTEYSDTVAEGLVTRTEPVAGSSIHKDDEIIIYVSLGVLMLDVPEALVGQTLEEAEQAIQDTGLTVGEVTEEYSRTAAAGTIISVDPGEGETIRHDQEVNLVVSLGRQPVEMPQVVGTTRAEAEQALSELGLSANITEAYSDTVAEGSIISQSSAAGSTVYDGDTINLVVSLGPEYVEVPDVFGKQLEEAQEILEAAGFVVEVNQIASFFNTVGTQNPQAGTQARRGSTVTIGVV